MSDDFSDNIDSVAVQRGWLDKQMAIADGADSALAARRGGSDGAGSRRGSSFEWNSHELKRVAESEHVANGQPKATQDINGALAKEVATLVAALIKDGQREIVSKLDEQKRVLGY